MIQFEELADEFEVEVRTGAAVLGKRKPRLIKIDVEGSEMQVLEGFKPFLQNSTSVGIIVECSPVHIRRTGLSVEEWIERLCSFNKDIWVIENDPPALKPLSAAGPIGDGGAKLDPRVQASVRADADARLKVRGMKVMLARSAAAREQADPLATAVEDLLRATDFEVQRLDLPPIDDGNPLKWLASWRLLPVDGMADALLCLDAWSAILNHSRKYVWLLDSSRLINANHPDDLFLTNVIRGGVREARRMFSPSAATDDLKQSGWTRRGRWIWTQLSRGRIEGRRVPGGMRHSCGRSVDEGRGC